MTREYFGKEDEVRMLDESGFADVAEKFSEELFKLGFSGCAIIASKLSKDNEGHTMASVNGKVPGLKQGCIAVMKKIDANNMGWNQ